MRQAVEENEEFLEESESTPPTPTAPHLLPALSE